MGKVGAYTAMEKSRQFPESSAQILALNDSLDLFVMEIGMRVVTDRKMMISSLCLEKMIWMIL